jgi:type IV pilus biogenesis protein CpaD/CtpE
MRAPDLTTYDVILVNISGGKDSQAALDEIVRQARQAGVMDRLVTVSQTWASLTNGPGRVSWQPSTPRSTACGTSRSAAW